MRRLLLCCKDCRKGLFSVSLLFLPTLPFFYPLHLSTFYPPHPANLPPPPPPPPPPPRTADVTTKLKLYSEQLSQVSELLTEIDLPEDGAPITLEWMKLRQEEIGMERSRIFGEKRADSNKLTKHKEMVLSELEKLRVLNRQHRKLMLEVWTHLTSLARVSQ